MNFLSPEFRDKYNFQIQNNSAQNNTPKKQYKCTCPLFSGIKNCFSGNSCNCNCNIFSCSCCKNINIRAFAKQRPYCFAGIITGIFFFILILIIIIAVSVNKKKKNNNNNEGTIVNNNEKINNSELLDFTNIDNLLKDIGNNDKGTLTQFCDYLKSKYSSLSEVEKVKLVYRWITKNIVYDEDGDVERDPEKFFESKTTVCSGFARLFKKLLVSMDYKEENILNIYGYAKGVDYNVNILPNVTHEWNAVKFNNEWCLLDATWDSKATNYSYFCTRPSCFVRDHLPEKEQKEYQFLEKPIELETFHNLAWTTGEFCNYNVQIIEDKSIINKCEGKYTIKYDDKDVQLNIIPEKKDKVEINKKINDDGFEVDFSVKEEGQFLLYLTRIDENLSKEYSIGNLYVKCSHNNNFIIHINLLFLFLCLILLI